MAQAGSVLLNLLKLQVLELQDEEKAKNLLSYLATMRLKMMEDWQLWIGEVYSGFVCKSESFIHFIVSSNET